MSVGCWAAWHLSFQKGRMHITVSARVWIPMIMWKLKLLYLLLPTFLHNLSKNFSLFLMLQRVETLLTLTFRTLTIFCCAILYSKTIMYNNDVRKSEYKFSRFFFFFLKWKAHKYEIEIWNSSSIHELFYRNYISKM